MGHAWFSDRRSNAVILPMFVKLFVLDIDCKVYTSVKLPRMSNFTAHSVRTRQVLTVSRSALANQYNSGTKHLHKAAALWVDAQTRFICGNPQMVQRSVRSFHHQPALLKNFKSH
jgi:hypothetical protein